MSEKYPCKTCEHYVSDRFRLDSGKCKNPLVDWQYASFGRNESRYLNRFPGCGNGRRHSGYVSVWRRAWRKIAGVKSDVVIPTSDFEGKPHEAGMWR